MVNSLALETGHRFESSNRQLHVTVNLLMNVVNVHSEQPMK